MKLDTRAIRYLTSEDWRVLTAAEMGSKNHEVVPTPLISQISGLRGASGVNRSISNLAKVGLIAKVKNAKYDGYRLTYGGLDYLALNTFIKRKSVYSIGNQVGVGKESDIYVVADETGTQRILKIHRLGRISFRTVKANRDYLRNRNAASWMYMSRLAAMKEFAFMKVLKDNGFPVPTPIDQARHCVLMELIDSYPLRQVTSIADPPRLYADLMALILKFAAHGLIHGDFNEFNILVNEDTQEPVVIDFPQMVSIDHANAKEYFDRDVQCIKTFFKRKFGFESEEEGPSWGDVKRTGKLDVEVEASGFSKKQAKELDKYLQTISRLDEQEGEGDHGSSANEDDEDDEEEEDQGHADNIQDSNVGESDDEMNENKAGSSLAPRSGAIV
ncbi:serine kinase rio2 [Drechslerella stenobrocha 248]|uniref:Serine/threonine-protein kinase RIO2 n=1 Tax=Drechslerella stenobrocha 248 TaxID=1043628 RepID=W7HQC1_9PEZI|nr:serine kinase rio2 [Drechslerella stenobrocha 248]